MRIFGGITKKRSWVRLALGFAGVLWVPMAQAQKAAIPLKNACSYFGEVLTGSAVAQPGSDEAEQMIRRIIDASGLAQNFRTLVAPVPNAAAVSVNGSRLILYNSTFIADLTARTRNPWAPISIMAHEIGHHLNGHMFSATAGTPALELEADFFSGFILQRLGASLADATIAMQELGSPTASASHPAKPERLAAITSGWSKACGKDGDCASDLSAPALDNETMQDGDKEALPNSDRRGVIIQQSR